MDEPIGFHLGMAPDAAAIVGLLAAQFQEHEIEVPGETLRAAVTAMFEKDGLGFFIVARDGDQAVGLAAVSFAWTLEHGGKSAWLDEVYVLPARRGRGIGTTLVREAVRLAAAAGCAAVDVEVDHDHARAEALYAREGFQRLPRARWVHPGSGE